MTRPCAVAITGYARSGKDSCAAALVDLGYTPVALADPLKELALQAGCYLPGMKVPLSAVVDIYGWERAKENNRQVRELLVRLGTAGRRVFAEGEDFWVGQALARAGDYPVFTDVRFHNEAAAIRRRYPDALFLRVASPGVSASSPFEDEVPDIAVDAVVCNDGSLEDLAFSVRETLLNHLGTVETAQQRLSFPTSEQRHGSRQDRTARSW